MYETGCFDSSPMTEGTVAAAEAAIPEDGFSQTLPICSHNTTHNSFEENLRLSMEEFSYQHNHAHPPTHEDAAAAATAMGLNSNSSWHSTWTTPTTPPTITILISWTTLTASTRCEIWTILTNTTTTIPMKISNNSCSKWTFKMASNASIILRYQTVPTPQHQTS
ncbi:hypothetical protein SLA2020_348520 [Shorea laevis]